MAIQPFRGEFVGCASDETIGFRIIGDQTGILKVGFALVGHLLEELVDGIGPGRVNDSRRNIIFWKILIRIDLLLEQRQEGLPMNPR